MSFQLVDYLDSNSPAKSPIWIWGYHSTESLFTRLLADVLGAFDRGQVTLLALYDIHVSSVFDTSDNSILLHGVSG